MNYLFNSLYEKYLNYFSRNFQDWTKIIVEITIVLIIFTVFHRGLFWVTSLPVDAYYDDFIYFEFLKRLIGKPYLIVIILFFIGFFNKKFLIGWRSFGNNNNLIRLFLFAIALILSWFYTTYDINFFFNKVHYADRISLVLLTLCVYWKPVFLIPYLTQLLIIIGQFEHLPNFSMGTQPFLLIKILILFVTFYVLNLFNRVFKPSLFIFMLGCLIATHYFTAGAMKVNVFWIFKDQISFMVPSAYANGWLSFLTEKSIADLSEFLSWLNSPLRLFTILIECGMLLFFMTIKWARFLIFGAIILHLGIFGYTGILFWMWIGVLILSAFMFTPKKYDLDKIFNKKYFIISIVIIGGGRFWCQAKSLAWCDAPLYYTYKIYGETSDGDKHLLAPNFFSHYDYQFTFDSNLFWQDQPRLSIYSGATDAKTGNYFDKERTVNEVFEYEKQNGRSHENVKKQKIYEQFLIQYMTNWNKKSIHIDYIKPIQALPFYWISSSSKIKPLNQKIEHVIIVESTTFYSKKTGFTEIRNEELNDLTIPNNQFKR